MECCSTFLPKVTCERAGFRICHCEPVRRLVWQSVPLPPHSGLTFPWGKGDRRVAVVDEGCRSSFAHKTNCYPAAPCTPHPARLASHLLLNEKVLACTYSPKTCCYRTASRRAIDNRPYDRGTYIVRFRRSLPVNELLPARALSVSAPTNRIGRTEGGVPMARPYDITDFFK